MIFTLVGPYPENIPQFFPNAENIPRLHPSKNPNCMSRWSADNDIYNYPQFKYKRRVPEEASAPESSIQIKATLASCSTSSANTKQYKSPKIREDAKECRQKITITMQMNNVGKMNTQEEFLVVDYILDPVTKRKIRLLNPYIIKIRQEAILQLYGLKFQGVVNAEAREEVINKNRPNFTGCNDGLENPTCGQTLLHGDPIPYSQGFCCSCEDEDKVRRRHGIPNELAGNSHSDGGPNCEDSTNKPCNRLAPQTAYVNILDNSQTPGREREEQLYSETTHSQKTTGSHAREGRRKQSEGITNTRITVASARRENERDSHDEKLMDPKPLSATTSTVSSGEKLRRDEKRQTKEDVLSSNGHVSKAGALVENKRNFPDERLTGSTDSQGHLASTKFRLPDKERTDREVASSSTGMSKTEKVYVTDERSPIPRIVLFADTAAESKMEAGARPTAVRVSAESDLARPEDRESVSRIEPGDGTKSMETIHVARKSGEPDLANNGRAHDRPATGYGADINLQPWNLMADPEELRNEVDAFKKMKSFEERTFSDNKPAKSSKFHNSMRYETHSEDRINPNAGKEMREGSSSSVSTSRHSRNYIERVTSSGSGGRIRSGQRNKAPGNVRVERGKKDSFEDSQSVPSKKSSTNSGKEVPSCAEQDSMTETTVTRPNVILKSSIADRNDELHKPDRTVVSELTRNSTFAGDGSGLLSHDLMSPGSSGRNELSVAGKSALRLGADVANGSTAKLENMSTSRSIPKQSNSIGIALKPNNKYKLLHAKLRNSKKELEENSIISKRRNEFLITDSKRKSKYNFKNGHSPLYPKLTPQQSPSRLNRNDNKAHSRPNKNRKKYINASAGTHPEPSSFKGGQTHFSRPSDSKPQTTVSAYIPNPDEGRYKDQYAAFRPTSPPYYAHSDEKAGRARRENSRERDAGPRETQISSKHNASRTKSYSAYETRKSMSANDFDENVKSTFADPLCVPSADSLSASSLAAETGDDPFYSSRNELRSSTANRRAEEKFKQIGSALAEAESDVDRTKSSGAVRIDGEHRKFATMSDKIRNGSVFELQRGRDQISRPRDVEFSAELPISTVKEKNRSNELDVKKLAAIENNMRNNRSVDATGQMESLAKCTGTEKPVIMADQLKILPIPTVLSPEQAVRKEEEEGKLANASESRPKLGKQTELATDGLILATRPSIDYFDTAKKALERPMITSIKTASAPIEQTGEDRNTSFATTISDLGMSEESSKRPFALRTNMPTTAATPGRRAPLSKKHSSTLPFRSYSQKRLHDISRARHGRRIRSHLPSAFLPDLKEVSDIGLPLKQKTAELSPFDAGLAPGLPTDYRPTEKNATETIETSSEARLGSETSSKITTDDVSRTESLSTATTETSGWQTTRITDQNFRPLARPATPFVPGRAKIVLSVDEFTFEEDEVDSSGESTSTVLVTFPVQVSSGPSSSSRIRSKFTVDSTQLKFEPSAESMSDKSSSGKIVVRSPGRWPDALRITSPSARTTVSGKLARMRKFGGNSSELRKLSKVDHETTRWGAPLLGWASFSDRARSEAPREDNFYRDYRMSSNKYGTNNTPEEIFSATDVSDGAMEKFRGSDDDAEHSKSNADKVGSGEMAKLAEPLKSAGLRGENMSGPNNVERYLERIRQTEDSLKGSLLGHAGAASLDKPKSTESINLTEDRMGIESNNSAKGELRRLKKRNFYDYVTDNYRIDAPDGISTEKLPVLMETDDSNDHPWSTTAGPSDALKNILFNLSPTTDDSPFNFLPLAELNADLSPKPIDEINFALENPNVFLRKYNLSREMKLALARELRRSDAFANFFDPPEDTADSTADSTADDSKINGEADPNSGDVLASFRITFPTAGQIGYQRRLPAATYSLYDATDATFAFNPTSQTFLSNDYPNFNHLTPNNYGPILRIKRNSLGAGKMATADLRTHKNVSRDEFRGCDSEADSTKRRGSSTAGSNRTSYRSDEAAKLTEITEPFRHSEKKIWPGKLYYDGSRAVPRSRSSPDKLPKSTDSPTLRRGNEGKMIKEEEEVATGVTPNNVFLATKNFADRILLACTGKFDNRQKDSARFSRRRDDSARSANDVLKGKNGESRLAATKSSAIYDAKEQRREFERTPVQSASDDDSGADPGKVGGNRVRDNSMSEVVYSLPKRSFDPSSSFGGEDEEGNLVFTGRKLGCLTDLSDRNAEKRGSDRLIDHRAEDARDVTGDDDGGYTDLLTSKEARDSDSEGEYIDDGINNFNIVRGLKGHVRRLLSIEMNLSRLGGPAEQFVLKRCVQKRKLLTQKSALLTENEIDRIQNSRQNNYDESNYKRERSLENTDESKFLKPENAHVRNRQDYFIATSEDDVGKVLQGSDGSFAKKIDKSPNSPEIGLLSNFKNVADELDGTSAFNELSSEKRFHSAIGYNPTLDNKGTDVRVGSDSVVESGAETAVRRNLLEMGDIRSAIDSRTKLSQEKCPPNQSMNSQENTIVNSQYGENNLDSIGMRPIPDENQPNKSPASYSMDPQSDTHGTSNDISKDISANGVPGGRLFSHVFNIESVPDALAHSGDTIVNKAGAVARVSHNIHARNSHRRERKDVELSMNPIEKLSIHGSKDVRNIQENVRMGSSNDIEKFERRSAAHRKGKIRSNKRKSCRTTTPPPPKYPTIFDNSRLISSLKGSPEGRVENPSESDLRKNEVDQSFANASSSGNSETVPLLSIKIDSKPANSSGATKNLTVNENTRLETLKYEDSNTGKCYKMTTVLQRMDTFLTTTTQQSIQDEQVSTVNQFNTEIAVSEQLNPANPAEFGTDSSDVSTSPPNSIIESDEDNATELPNSEATTFSNRPCPRRNEEIRRKNMIAIKDFINRLHTILSNDASENSLPNVDEFSIHINRFVMKPDNESVSNEEDCGCCTTEKVIIMGEGTKHHIHENQPENDDRQSGVRKLSKSSQTDTDTQFGGAKGPKEKLVPSRDNGRSIPLGALFESPVYASSLLDTVKSGFRENPSTAVNNFPKESAHASTLLRPDYHPGGRENDKSFLFHASEDRHSKSAVNVTDNGLPRTLEFGRDQKSSEEASDSENSSRESLSTESLENGSVSEYQLADLVKSSANNEMENLKMYSQSSAPTGSEIMEDDASKCNSRREDVAPGPAERMNIFGWQGNKIKLSGDPTKSVERQGFGQLEAEKEVERLDKLRRRSTDEETTGLRTRRKNMNYPVNSYDLGTLERSPGIESTCQDIRVAEPSSRTELEDRTSMRLKTRFQNGAAYRGGVIKKREKRKRKKKKKKKKGRRKKKKKGRVRNAEYPVKWRRTNRRLLAVSDDQEFPLTSALNEDEEGPAKGYFFQEYEDLSGRFAKRAGKRRWETSKKSKRRPRIHRQIEADGAQIRGGQDCTDQAHPANVSLTDYSKSAHCLRFSNLWYSVYELEEPIIEHVIYLELYEKRTLPNGSAHWNDLTRGSIVRLGTFNTHHTDDEGTIAFVYNDMNAKQRNRERYLDPAKDRLLIPSTVASGSGFKNQGSSGEYLVVDAEAINENGNECDKAGVGFAAFAGQANRCGRVRGTCLKNQPLAYWRHDMEARMAGQPGCYFLSNFASVPTDPIKYNVSGSGSREFLGLEYDSPHVSTIDIEVRADNNAAVKAGTLGRINEVYVDNTDLEHTVVIAIIKNTGPTSSSYQLQTADCPKGLPITWTKAKSPVQIITPQLRSRMTIDIAGRVPSNEFYCSLELVNHHGEPVATRRIKIRKMDRCHCVWHCECTCVGSDSGQGCQPMSLEHYHAAGFRGPVPVLSSDSFILSGTVRDVLLFTGLLALVLLAMGMIKWFIGLFMPAVGRWGIDAILSSHGMSKYFEQELKCRCVVTDKSGLPVHPDTLERTVRICSRKLEFFLNLIFFMVYPIVTCCSCMKNLCRSKKQRQCTCSKQSKTSQTSEQNGDRKYICMKTYKDYRNTKTEAEDMKYVMKELRKSQESLRDYMKYERNYCCRRKSSPRR